ncbi:MAG: sugar phosphate isomerase/epimerase [Patescibacteria group bacterium]|nr:sugar phosphate isomerase/epimerase [Patescibacteria group bacterium]
MFKNLNPFTLGVTGHQSEIIELALTYGFGGMDLNADEFALRVLRRGAEHAKRLLESAKVKIGTFALPFEPDADDESFKQGMERLPKAAEAVAVAGCTRCVAMVAPAGDKRPYHENFEFHRRRFSEICAALAPHGIRLGIGFRAAEYLRKDQAFQFIHDFDALSLLVSMVAADNVGVILDVWDLYVGGGSIETIRSLTANQIVAVQVAELAADQPVAEVDTASRLMPNAEGGRIHVASILGVLKEKGYTGPVTAAPSRAALPSKRRDVIVRRTGEALEAVWRIAGLGVDHRLNASVEAAPPKPAPAAEPVAEPVA